MRIVFVLWKMAAKSPCVAIHLNAVKVIGHLKCQNKQFKYCKLENFHLQFLFFKSTWDVMMTKSTQRAHEVNITSPQRQCNVMTLHRRWGDVIFTSCACPAYSHEKLAINKHLRLRSANGNTVSILSSFNIQILILCESLLVYRINPSPAELWYTLSLQTV